MHIADNYIAIDWDISSDEDFQYFELVRSGGSGGDVYLELVETAFEDYGIEAGIDIHTKLPHMTIMEILVANDYFRIHVKYK